ncbi:MAG: hypothetical protein B6244_09115 [Candidatus Cloacimonetes bacterium 4572_55]|nr:MAG: hypothetical protein B6244_09115 [Candidatus Cloacimonetes bacterium 4572_55]
MLLVKMRKKLAEEQGISLAGAVIFIFLTIVLSMSFLYIPVYNAQSFEVMYDEAQIYWTLKAGHAIALTHLQNRPAVENSFIESHNKELTIENETVAKIPKIRIDRAKKSGSTTFTNAYVYKISVGDNKMDVLNGKNQVRRFQDLIVEKTSYALYAYLSDIETAPNGTITRLTIITHSRFIKEILKRTSARIRLIFLSMPMIYEMLPANKVILSIRRNTARFGWRWEQRQIPIIALRTAETPRSARCGERFTMMTGK